MAARLKIREMSPDSRYWYYKEKHANWYAANKERADKRTAGKFAEMPPLNSLRKPLSIEEKRKNRQICQLKYRTKVNTLKKQTKVKLGQDLEMVKIAQI